MLAVHQVTKAYNLDIILHNVTFSLKAGERVGLIGPNGAGKTTLLRLVAGLEPPDSGSIQLVPSTLRLGYLAQGLLVAPDETVGRFLGPWAGEAETPEAAIARLGRALADQPEDPGLQAAYDQALQALSRPDTGRAASILAALGLDGIPPEQPVAELSGGQKTRLSLARLLLEGPELLLLDEPTNHLDIEMLEWLEAWLATFPGAALIVSHDRAFLDRTVNRIVDLDPQTHGVREYTGNYSDYLAQYLADQDRQWATWRDQLYEERRLRQDIARTREQARWVERTTTPRQPNVRRLAKKVARKARSRERKLERYLASDERVEKPRPGWQMNVSFEVGGYQGREVLTVANLSVGYPGRPPLLADLNLSIQAGQRVVLTGPNGCGKSSLLRTIIGRLAPLTGQVRLGATVRPGYMSQDQALLRPDESAVEAIRRTAAGPMDETEIRTFLHLFLFKDDDPLRPTRQLSFGERARLALATLVAQGSNLLLLDEPINHLDIPSRTQFEQTLHQFPGAVLAVVHDRYFIEHLATDLWLVENGGITPRVLTLVS